MDAEGDIKGIMNIHRILQDGGRFCFSAPIAPVSRVDFNAHRIYSPEYLASFLQPLFDIERFSYVDTPGDLHVDASIQEGRTNGVCGIFELIKRPATPTGK